MKDRGPIYTKSRQFAGRIVDLYTFLRTGGEYTISTQVLRSGTSIGANVYEAIGAESDADFVHKLSIARKEAYETEFWIDLLHDKQFISEESYASIHEDVLELIKMLTSIILRINEKL